jgi:hypothetical protein
MLNKFLDIQDCIVLEVSYLIISLAQNIYSFTNQPFHKLSQ